MNRRNVHAACVLSAFLFLAPVPGLGDLLIGLMPADNSIPLVVAQRDGLFRAEGVRVTLVPFSGQLERETALQTGAIDGTVSDLVNVIQSWSHGFGARVTSVTEGSFSLLAAPGSWLRSMADWDSRDRVSTGLLENSLVYYLSERMVAARGADPGRIELVPIVQVPARLEMLIAGRVDAACIPEPLATLAESRGARRLARSDDLGLTPGVLLFTRQALSSRGQEIRAFYRAYDAATRALAADPERYRDAIVEGCGFPPAVRDTMTIPAFHPARLPTAAEVADVARWMRSKGLLQEEPAWTDVVAQGFVAGDAQAP